MNPDNVTLDNFKPTHENIYSLKNKKVLPIEMNANCNHFRLYFKINNRIEYGIVNAEWLKEKCRLINPVKTDSHLYTWDCELNETVVERINRILAEDSKEKEIKEMQDRDNRPRTPEEIKLVQKKNAEAMCLKINETRKNSPKHICIKIRDPHSYRMGLLNNLL